MSGGLLWLLGYNYDGLSGGALTKIHPFTYMIVALFGSSLIVSGDPIGRGIHLANRRPASLLMLVVALALLVLTIMRQGPGLAGTIDTYVGPALLVLLLADADERTLARLETLLHALLAFNALLGLVEYAIDQRLIPFRFDGVMLEWDKRSNGLLGHPLENAQMTGLYIMVLLGGGGRSLPQALRPAAVLLQLAALVPFGGRTALLLTLAMSTVWLIPRIAHVLRGGRMSLPAFAAIAVLLPALVLGVGLIALGGFFDVILDRFVNDGGSAKTRVEMFEMLGQLTWREVFVGADNDYIELLRRSHGLESGIENPIVRLLLYQGVIFTTFLIAGFTCS